MNVSGIDPATAAGVFMWEVVASWTRHLAAKFREEMPVKLSANDPTAGTLAVAAHIDMDGEPHGAPRRTIMRLQVEQTDARD